MAYISKHKGSKGSSSAAGGKILKKGSSSDTLAANAYKAPVGEIVLESEPSLNGSDFMDHLILLYGAPKIGKTTFAATIPGNYLIATEPGFKSIKCRKTYIKNWAEFTKFVELIEKDKKILKTISLFAIDTIDNLSKFCMQFTCGRLAIGHPSDLQWGKGWEAFRDEFTYWILRLCSLEKGLLFISHEGEREIVYKGLQTNKCVPSMPKTCYTVVNNLVDLIVRMGYDIETPKKDRKGVQKKEDEQRCLMTRNHPLYDAGNRTKVGIPDKIFFSTEEELYKELQGYFE
jgi:hypothetical protein